MRRLLQERTWCGNYVTKRSDRNSNGSSNCCLFCVRLARCAGTQQKNSAWISTRASTELCGGLCWMNWSDSGRWPGARPGDGTERPSSQLHCGSSRPGSAAARVRPVCIKMAARPDVHACVLISMVLRSVLAVLACGLATRGAGLGRARCPGPSSVCPKHICCTQL